MDVAAMAVRMVDDFAQEEEDGIIIFYVQNVVSMKEIIDKIINNVTLR